MRFRVDEKDINEYCSFLLSRLDKRIPKELKADIVFQAALLYLWGGYFKRAEELLSEWMEKLKSRRQETYILRLMYLLGMVKGLLKERGAEKIKKTAEEQLKAQGKVRVIYEICTSAADLLSQKNPHTALGIYLDAYKVAREADIGPDLLGDLAMKIAFNLKDLGKLKDALKYALEGLEYREKSGDSELYNAYVVVADINRKLGDLGKAIEYLAIAFNLVKKMGLKKEIGELSIALAELYNKAGDAKRASALLRENLETIRELGDDEMMKRAMEILKQER